MFEWFVLVLKCDAFVVIVLSDEPRQNHGRGLVNRKKLKRPPSNLIAGRPKAAFLFWLLVILDVACRYLSLCLLYLNIEIGKK